MNFTGSYAYKLKLQKDHFFSLGLSMGLSWQKADQQQIQVLHPDDPWIINASWQEQTHFINELGLLYANKGFNLGIAIPYVVQSAYQQFYSYASLDIGAPRNKPGFTVTPLLMYRYLPSRIQQVDASLRLRYKNIWTSGTFRTNGNLFLAAVSGCVELFHIEFYNHIKTAII